MKRLKNNLIICVITFLLLTLVPNAVFANYFDGAKASPYGNIQGVSSNIGTAKYPSVYQYFSCAWNMVANTSSSNNYIQTGWMYNYGSPMKMNYFFEWANNSTDWSRVYSAVGPAENSTHKYETILQNGTWYGKVDNATIGYKSSSEISWVPNSVQYYGEVVNWNAAFPGQSNNRVRFSNIKYNDGGLWFVPDLNERVDYEGGFEWIDTTTFEIWDKRY